MTSPTLRKSEFARSATRAEEGGFVLAVVEVDEIALPAVRVLV
jgi:hypothetical protein